MITVRVQSPHRPLTLQQALLTLAGLVDEDMTPTSPPPPMLWSWLRARERFFGPLVAAAIAISGILLFWLILPQRFQINESTDFLDFYQPVARGLLSGQGLVDANGDPAVRYPPGYPLILAGLFWIADGLRISEAAMLRVFTLFCFAMSSVAIYLMARRTADLPAAFLAPLGFAAYPLLLWLTKQPNSEAPFMVFLYFGFLLLWSAATAERKLALRCFSGGLLLGIAMLIRPTAIGVAVTLAPLYWLWRRDLAVRRRLVMMTLVLAGNVAPIVPWQMWTVSQGIGVIPLSTAGPEAMLAGLTSSVRPHDWREEIDLAEDLEALMLRLNNREMEIREGFSSAVRVVLEEGLESPLAMIQLWARKVARCWYATDSQRFERAILLLQIPFLLAFLWSSKIAWGAEAASRSLTQGTWALVLYFWAMCAITYPLVRYMVPVTGLLFALLPALLHKRSLRPSDPRNGELRAAQAG